MERARVSRNLIRGRPDFGNPDFGKTLLKRFPPYVYSRLGGMLIHRVLRVEAQWYQAVYPGDALERLPCPRLTFVAVCGQSFYAGAGPRSGRSQACAIPKPGAVLCGRCSGTGPVFGKGLAERDVKRRDARARIGCVAEVA